MAAQAYKLGDVHLSVRSVAGESTCIMVTQPFMAMFDIGGQHAGSLAQDTVFVSHGHMDHVAALPWHASARALHRTAPPAYVVPDNAAPSITALLEACRALNEEPGEAIPARVVPVSGGDRVLLASKPQPLPASGTATGAGAAPASASRVHVVQGAADEAAAPGRTGTWPFQVTSFAVQHRVPCLGYIVHRRRVTLSAEARGMSRGELTAATAEGRCIHDVTLTPVMAVSGDTVINAVVECPDALVAPLLTLECTYLLDEKRTSVDKCRERGHVHLVEFAAAWAKGTFKNQHILLLHMSQRYTLRDAQRAVPAALRAALSAELRSAPVAGGESREEFESRFRAAVEQRPRVHIHRPPRMNPAQHPRDMEVAVTPSSGRGRPHSARGGHEPRSKRGRGQHRGRSRGRGRGRGGHH